MAVESGTPSPALASSLWADLPDPSARPLPYLITTLLVLLVLYSLQGPSSNSTIKALPHLNPSHPLEPTTLRSKKEFFFNCRRMLAKWASTSPDQPVRLITGDAGELVLLPPEFANEIRNDSRLSFSRFVAQVCVPENMPVPAVAPMATDRATAPPPTLRPSTPTSQASNRTKRAAGTRESCRRSSSRT